LASEIHLGYINYGKTRSKHGQVELVPEEERIKVMGTHEKLKTPEEHEVIMERLLKNRMLNPNSRRNIFPLSGLLYCEKCSSRMRFQVGENKKQGQYWTHYATTSTKMAVSSAGKLASCGAAVTSEEKNRSLKKLVERIVYNPKGNKVELTVCYR
jgi:hypothetical protein